MNNVQVPFASCSVPLSAADFFRDSPWLNIPQHRRAEITLEPLYPRLGLLGGAPQEGKMSKLAALAAARKKKTSENPLGAEEPSQLQSSEQKQAPRSLSERLAVNNSRTASKTGGLSSITRQGRPASGQTTTSNSSSKVSRDDKGPVVLPIISKDTSDQTAESQKPEEKADLRASPSTFAATIVGNGSRSSMPEPSHLLGNNFDVMQIYHQDLIEAFDFAGPSPDDVVLNAQSASKGLPIRGTR